MADFLYNLISRDGAGPYNLSEEWWAEHPDWNFYCRTNVRHSLNPRVWLGGGGATAEEAVKMATESVNLDRGKKIVMTGGMTFVGGSSQLVGEPTNEVIKNKE